MKQNSAFYLGKKVGILGGGQLAQMLLEPALQLALNTHVYAESEKVPAARYAIQTQVGSLTDEKKLRHFFSSLDLVLFENEFIPIEPLRRAAQGLEVEFFPSLDCLEVLQNKQAQKNLLLDCQIPSAPFLTCLCEETAPEFVGRALSFFGDCVLKWSMNGYDGKGVFFLNSTTQASAIAFCQKAFEAKQSVYAEKKVLFVRELAIVSTASNKEITHYPLVISKQKDGICHSVYGSATALGVSPSLEHSAQEYSRRVAQAIGLKGSFALEFFETPEGELWVNEIAPRVHNSGHYTQNASQTSQFENHLRAALELPLGSSRSTPYFAMQNLLGPQVIQASKIPTQSFNIPAELHLHWYGKEEIKAGRKLGHVNTLAGSLEEFETNLKTMETFHEDWKTKMQKQ